jgi:predicted PurR-regulated permease PerM
MEASRTGERSERASTTFYVLAAAACAVWLLAPLLDVLLLAFAGLLLAVFLSGIGGWLAARTFLSKRLATISVVVLWTAAVVVVARIAAPDLAKQVEDLSEALPKAISSLTDSMRGYPGGNAIIDRLEEPADLLGGREAFSRARGLLSSSIGALASFLAFLFIGLFVAYEPALYHKGLLRLVPVRRRESADAVLMKVAHVLRLWMLSKLLSMTVVGGAIWLGLSLLDVPLAFVLALLSAVLTFIPNFGPVLSAMPPILLAVADSPSKALLVIALYVGVQTVESYLLTPLIERETVALPPALTITAQLAMGIIAGAMGVVVATPLTAVALVVMKHVYVEGVLHDVDDTAST